MRLLEFLLLQLPTGAIEYSVGESIAATLEANEYTTYTPLEYIAATGSEDILPYGGAAFESDS